jgi:hypothetical protein
MNQMQVEYLLALNGRIRRAQVESISERTLSSAGGWMFARPSAMDEPRGSLRTITNRDFALLRLVRPTVACQVGDRPGVIGGNGPTWNEGYCATSVTVEVPLPVPVNEDEELPEGIAKLRQKLQLAIQRANLAMDEVRDYLDAIDEKRENMRGEGRLARRAYLNLADAREREIRLTALCDDSPEQASETFRTLHRRLKQVAIDSGLDVQ